MGFTAKNFRTWAATSLRRAVGVFVLSANGQRDENTELKSIPSVESMGKLWTSGDWKVPTTDAGRSKAMLAVIDTVAADAAMKSRLSFLHIHPWFLDAWTEGRLGQAWAEFADMRAMGNMTSGESTTLRLLKSVVEV